MKVMIQFKHTETHWVGHLMAGSNLELLGAGIEKHGSTRLRRPQPKPVPDPHGVKAAENTISERDASAVISHWPKAMRSAEEFEGWFIECVKRHILKQASRYGKLLVPTNYFEEIWTRSHVIALAARLRKKTHDKHARSRFLQELLTGGWEKSELCKMNPEQLCAWVNDFFPQNPFKAPAIRQVVDRLGLSTDLRQGPKSRL
jgi:hypothetical protein